MLRRQQVATGPGDLELVIRDGEEAGHSFEIPVGEEATIGRSPECGIVLSEAGVSRVHCRIENLPDGAVVFDLDSANGTYVNGTAVSEAPLRPGDELMLGPTVLECRRSLVQLPGPAALGEPSLHLHDDAQSPLLRKVVSADEGAALAEDSTPEELRRAQENLTTAYRVSKLLVRALDSDHVYQQIIDAIFQNIAAERVGLLLRDPETSDEGGGLRVVAARSREGVDDARELNVSRSVIRDVLENGASLLSWDAAMDERYKDQESVMSQQIRAVICAPIASDEEVLGVLYADTLSRAGAFSENDLDLLALIGNQAGIAIRRAQLQEDLEQSFFDTIRAIVATIDAKDGYTHHHSERVGEFAVRIARELGRSEKELQIVRLASLVHDLGKVGIPENILNKPGELTEEEYEQVRLHPVRGVEILEHIHSPLLDRLLPGVRHHHERWDGSGYPDGLAGDKIPFLGRLIAVADVLDALSSGRPYRDAMTFQASLRYLLERAGSHFDPRVVDAAVRLHAQGRLEVPPRSSGAAVESKPVAGSSLTQS